MLVPAPVVTVQAIITLITVLFLLSLTHVRRGQVENLAGELGPLLESLLLLALGEAFFGFVPFTSLTELIVVHDLRESVLSLVLRLKVHSNPTSAQTTRVAEKVS